jgi:hypothetical protein
MLAVWRVGCVRQSLRRGSPRGQTLSDGRKPGRRLCWRLRCGAIAVQGFTAYLGGSYASCHRKISVPTTTYGRSLL